MSKNSDTAQELYLQGNNCAQSVIAVFCEKYGLSKDMAFAICDGFGKGMRCGEMCGAVSGAVAVIGLANSKQSTDNDSEKSTRTETVQFIKKFREKHSKVCCRELIKPGKDLRKNCAGIVAGAVELLEEMGY